MPLFIIVVVLVVIDDRVVGYHGHEICIYTCTPGCHGYSIYEVQCIGQRLYL
jgi:hypothetical protein